ncbi:MAG: L-serine ammonia-lyase, iron-sulfur-dependent subunit beta [Candidatus Fournierella pullistercoris]|uniref:L-serine deaminase n=1 Tax=Candidatus Allofournierella pullistercoris TaxID=2838597 RepID=A0A948WRY3_9FIRM|nr:L-serine ammonia-lyase, iron-sulfur-dependent subunit beta [Candidatus Fournierella pullistercoris]
MNVFDILGPVMIGPSSSHTAGAVRIGRIAHALLGHPAVKADIALHGSFAKTYKGHGTDKALIAGIMGMAPDDDRIRNAPQLAAQQGLEITLRTVELDDAHPNTAQISLTDAQNRTITVQGASIGGGNIQITQINSMDVLLTGQYTAIIVLHQDTPGTIAAVTQVLASCQANICNFRLSRQKKGGLAVMTIELDGTVTQDLIPQLDALPNIFSSTMLKPQ